jgi:hypothetical protein
LIVHDQFDFSPVLQDVFDLAQWAGSDARFVVPGYVPAKVPARKKQLDNREHIMTVTSILAGASLSLGAFEQSGALPMMNSGLKSASDDVIVNVRATRGDGARASGARSGAHVNHANVSRTNVSRTNVNVNNRRADTGIIARRRTENRFLKLEFSARPPVPRERLLPSVA